MWIDKKNAALLIDRPFQPGFVDKLGIDITGSSMTEQIRRCRQAAMKALGKVMWEGYYHLLEPNSVKLVGDVYEKGINGEVVMDIYPWVRHVSFDVVICNVFLDMRSANLRILDRWYLI